MKLYYAPAASSLAPHIVAREAGLSLEIEKVNVRGDHKTETGEDFYKINPKGYIPALKLDDGNILTECVALMQYLADQAPGKNLTPAAGSFQYYQLEEWLAFMNSEIHKSFGPLFNPAMPEAAKELARANLDRRFAYLDEHLAKNTYVMGDKYSIADSYLFAILGWPAYAGYDMAKFPNLQSFAARISQRPAVQAALRAEGLIS